MLFCWFLVVLDCFRVFFCDFWWILGYLANYWWFLIVFGSSLTVLCGSLWVFCVFLCGSWWFLVVSAGSW